MVAPGMLQNPSVRNWLGGILPAWTLLDQDSFEALRRPPSSRASVITLARDFSPDEIGQSAVARNTLILLHAASVGSGLKLTTTGNLTRGVVAEMIDLFTWPGFDKAEAFRLHKVINEPDFLPLYFVRHVAESIRLVRQYKGHLKITPVGRQVLEDPSRQALQALLFHTVMWGIDLNYLGRGLHEGWPHGDVGVLLEAHHAVAAHVLCQRQQVHRRREGHALPVLARVDRHDMIDRHDDLARHAAELDLLTLTQGNTSLTRQVLQSLQSQNAVTPAGVIEAGPERISVRTSGQFVSEKDLQAVNLRLNDRFYRLADIAEITRGYVDPPAPMFRFNGTPAIGLAIAISALGFLSQGMLTSPRVYFAMAEDGSFFRIRNLQVGYNLNADALRKVNIKSFRIFANVQNLKTWKRNSGYSPEFGGSPTQFGIDDGNGPIPVIYTAGINVNF